MFLPLKCVCQGLLLLTCWRRNLFLGPLRLRWFLVLVHWVKVAGISGFYGPLFHGMGTYGTISSLLSSFGRLMIVLDVPQLTNEWCFCIWVRRIARTCVNCRPFLEQIFASKLSATACTSPNSLFDMHLSSQLWDAARAADALNCRISLYEDDVTPISWSSSRSDLSRLTTPHLLGAMLVCLWRHLWWCLPSMLLRGTNQTFLMSQRIGTSVLDLHLQLHLGSSIWFNI